MKMLLYALAAASILAACQPSAAVVQSATPSATPPLDRVVEAQLDSAVVLMANNGFALQRPFRGGTLARGAAEDVTLDLAAGRNYMIMGVCDADCDDLDLALRDASGTLVDSDYEPDDVPIVAVTPARDGRYRVTVSVAACRSSRCGYGVAVFAQ